MAALLSNGPRRAFRATRPLCVLALLAGLGTASAGAQESAPGAAAPSGGTAQPAPPADGSLPAPLRVEDGAASMADGEPLFPAAPGVVPPALPHDLSPVGMFRQADIVVKSVLVGLGLASILNLAILFAKSLEIAVARRRARRAIAAIAAADGLPELLFVLGRAKGPGAEMARAAADEAARTTPIPGASAGGLKERVASRLSRIEAGGGRALQTGTGLLATIGSTAPFVGLFGTVWGIMNAFIGISQAQTTNLAIVAPGIAEALFATAIGLVAAIPAVVIYNAFARQIAGVRHLLADAAAGVERLVSREVERAGASSLRIVDGSA
ncbi:tonB-system energizer ExbB [Aurantimonas sp. Leaf443]|uniref:tonB-system energizer ExbB n=1 Tax=Aurantimonas sp. Leaf443 TaxID=1736378 RepID=UPI0006FBDCF3|nr:tonB-system energizer ExbB [Aurantimonas sp. Leaf443]KQT85327.1 hypothetical protein ASG48_08750 [Aurantimonas sp. Leaf443]